MLDSTKTKTQLQNELAEMRQRVFELEQSEAMRKQIEEALRESEECFRKVYENMAVGVAQVSLDFCIESANNAYCHMLGYREEELIGKHLKDITHPEIVEENLQKQARLAAGEIDHYRMEKQFIHKSGRVVYGILDANLVRDAQGQPVYFLGSVLDITERKRAENTLKKYAAQLETLNTIATALSTSLELDNVLELILNQIGKVIPFDSGAIFLYEDAGLRVMVDRNLTRSPRGHLFPGEDELFAEILQTRTPLILNNPKKDARFKNWGHSEHIASWMGVPLIVRDTLIGFLTLDSNLPETYSSEQADLTRSFASQAAQAIENARLYARVIQDTNEMERRVQVRTKELQSFVNLTAGREIRMAELKRVIVKLRTQLENAGITPIANDPLLGPVDKR